MSLSPPWQPAGWKDALALPLRTLKSWPWYATVRTLRQRFREDRLGLTAGSLTFTTLIALVPLLTVMLAVFSAFPMFRDFRLSLEKYFLRTLVPDAIAKPVLGTLNQFAAKASGLGGMGLVILLVTALAVMLTIDRTLNGIWRVRRPRPIAQRVLVYWAGLTLGPLAIGLSLSLTSYAISASKGLVAGMPGAVGLVLGTLQFVLLAASMAGLFHYVPNTPVLWRHALAGGLFVAIGFEVAKRLLALYLQLVPTYSTVYGAFATVPILLVWMYLGWVIVLLGAVVAAYAPSLQLRVTRRPHAPGERFALALEVLRQLDAARHSPARGVTIGQLIRALRVEARHLDPVIDALIALDWVARLEEGGAQRHVLLCEPAETPAAGLVARLLIEPGAEVQSFWQHTGMASLTLDTLLAAPQA
jgi:membrane protein